MKTKVNADEIIDAYNNGESMNSIGKRLGMFAASIQRILEKNHVELRHDSAKKGVLVVKDGEKLIEWAKSQERLVSKQELADIIGTKKLSPSYFIKYPELGQYIESSEQKDIRGLAKKLYAWLKENKIPYKPNDRTRLGVSVSALLLGDYSNIALQIIEKPYYMSRNVHNARMKAKLDSADKAKVKLIFLDKKLLDDLNSMKSVLDSLKS